jgi:hypothetical protein
VPSRHEGCARLTIFDKKGRDLSAPIQEKTPRKVSVAERVVAAAQADPWHSVIEKFVAGRSSSTTSELLEAVSIPPAQQTKQLEMRAAATLRQLGWIRTTGWDAVRGKAFKHWTAPEVVRGGKSSQG